VGVVAAGLVYVRLFDQRCRRASAVLATRSNNPQAKNAIRFIVSIPSP
jgi:hypothetical protein